jgi:hypothetical protein
MLETSGKRSEIRPASSICRFRSSQASFRLLYTFGFIAQPQIPAFFPPCFSFAVLVGARETPAAFCELEVLFSNNHPTKAPSL